MSSKCPVRMLRGERKGKKCGKKVKNGCDMCSYHFRQKSNRQSSTRERKQKQSDYCSGSDCDSDDSTDCISDCSDSENSDDDYTWNKKDFIFMCKDYLRLNKDKRFKKQLQKFLKKIS